MTIKISRNAAGNCINFVGSSLPAYFNACLSGEVDSDDPTKVNVINDIQTANNPNGDIRYEFYQIPFTDFSDKDGVPFANAQAAADYITQEGHVLGVSDVGTDLTGVVVNFRLDQTNTSIIMDNGAAFGVNTLKAVPDADGTIHLHAIGAGVPEDSNEPDDHKHYEKLDHTNVQINGVAVAGGLNDVCNALNELFTVGAFESVVISDPYSTLIADVDGTPAGHTLVGNTAVDPIGNDIFGNTTSGNYAGLLSTETIDQAGEYYTFDIRGEGTIGFGLVHTQDSYDDGNYSGNSSYADPASFAVGNSAHFGYQFSHWFHPTPNGSWTNYGANTGFSMRAGWSNWDQQADWLAGNPVKVRCGIDTNGYISIESLQDDGSWVVHVRTSYPVAQGSEFRLGIKSSSSSARVYSSPKVHLLEPAAPAMYFRYIESPDGYYTYPLFATAEEADYYELTQSGVDNGSTQMLFEDDAVAGTVWHMPATSHQQNYGLTPIEDGNTSFEGNAINWTEITSLTNAQMTPSAFSGLDITVNEGAAVNIQVTPQDATWTTTVTGLPAGLSYDALSGSIVGSAPSVDNDNVTNPSDDYVITVERTNNYGSATGTMTLTVTNLTAPTVDTGDWGASTGTITSGVLQEDSSADLDITLSEGERLIIPKAWVDAHVSPNNLDVDEKAYLGTLRSDATTSTIEIGDFAGCFRFAGRAGTASHEVRMNDQLGSSVGNQTFIQNGASTYDYAIELHNGSLYLIACNVNSINTEPAVADGGSFSRTLDCGAISDNSLSSPLTITLGTGTGAVVDLDDSLTSEEITKITIPSPAAPANQTPWTKALDFSGSSEHGQMVTSNSYWHPMIMGQTGITCDLPLSSGATSAHYAARPWATACVFQADRNSSNQHIWNMGDGAGNLDDNIYLRLDASGQVYFGWGRQGALNECEVLNIPSSGTSEWYGVYVASNGARLSGSDATAVNLADAFEIRVMSSEGGDNFTTLGTNQSTSSNWATTGGRMDRVFAGNMTIGGRGGNRSFHGKVASFVTTTLKRADSMPSNTEIQAIISDPVRWLEDYKIGQSFRQGSSTSNISNFTLNQVDSSGSTQIWLMGDGPNDSYSNMIRNITYNADQNYTKLNLLSMVSNDIQNVTINGLS